MIGVHEIVMKKPSKEGFLLLAMEVYNRLGLLAVIANLNQYAEHRVVDVVKLVGADLTRFLEFKTPVIGGEFVGRDFLV